MVGHNLHLGYSQRTYWFIAELKEQCGFPPCQISFVSSEPKPLGLCLVLLDLPRLCSVVHAGQCFLLSLSHCMGCPNLSRISKPPQFSYCPPIFTNRMFRFLSATLLFNPPPPTAASIEFWACYTSAVSRYPNAGFS